MPVAAAFALYLVTLDGRVVLPRARALVVEGRALLPVRALGAALDAGVVYDPRSRTIAIRRGERRATLGAGTFRVAGGRAYAPLRDAAAAFGLRIAYDAPSRTIALASPAAPPAPAPAAPATFAPARAIVTPADGARLHEPNPTLTVRFPGAAVAPGALTMTIDGRDVGASASVVGDTVSYVPPHALEPGTHDVVVVAQDASGRPLRARWSFVDDFRFTSPPPPTPPAIEAFYVDRLIAPGTRAFDVWLRGEPGLVGAVAVDGVPVRFPLRVAGANLYVAHVVVPIGVVQPFAHVAARVSLPDGTVRTIVMAETLTILTATPRPSPSPTPVRRRKPL